MSLFLPVFILQIYVALLSYYLKYYDGLYQRDKLARSATLRITSTHCYFCLCRTKAPMVDARLLLASLASSQLNQVVQCFIPLNEA